MKVLFGKNIHGKAIRRVSALLAVLLLAGCGDSGNIEDLNAFVRESGTDMRGKVNQPDVPSPVPAVNFKGTGPVRQPFDPARLDAPALQKAPQKRITR